MRVCCKVLTRIAGAICRPLFTIHPPRPDPQQADSELLWICQWVEKITPQVNNYSKSNFFSCAFFTNFNHILFCSPNASRMRGFVLPIVYIYSIFTAIAVIVVVRCCLTSKYQMNFLTTETFPFWFFPSDGPHVFWAKGFQRTFYYPRSGFVVITSLLTTAQDRHRVGGGERRPVESSDRPPHPPNGPHGPSVRTVSRFFSTTW